MESSNGNVSNGIFCISVSSLSEDEILGPVAITRLYSSNRFCNSLSLFFTCM
ncbi:hypothetical protein X975_16940, partial [Stegodyphus mimosarum]